MVKTVIPDLLSYETVFRFSTGVVDFVEIAPYAHYEPVIHQHTDEIYIVAKGEIAYYIDGTEYVYGEGDVFKVPRGVAHGFINFTNEQVEIFSVLFPKYDPEDVIPVEAKGEQFLAGLNKLAEIKRSLQAG